VGGEKKKKGRGKEDKEITKRKKGLSLLGKNLLEKGRGSFSRKAGVLEKNGANLLWKTAKPGRLSRISEKDLGHMGFDKESPETGER